ncbi:MAG TPA: MBL fold metallo-hydrolase, partial [Opitutus sp.]|nr:MBL fold metallo-hydrolase [Opitutus sp.]
MAMKIQYLGQAGFSFHDASRMLVLDPYLSDSVDRLPGFPAGFWTRAYPPPVTPAGLRDANLVLCTHDHLDHADPETLLGIAAAAPGCEFGGPRATVELLHRIGIPPERTVMLNAGRSQAWRGITIEPIAAAHERYE